MLAHMDSGGVSPRPHPADKVGQVETATLLAITAAALVIRIYLILTSYCISGDGVGYLVMARQFAAGEWRTALSAVFSPLYPLLVSVAHCAIPQWEMAGNVVSTVLGTGAVVTVYLMTREAFGRSDLALGAAGMMAVHPEMAAYSASVRTEAGYVFFATGTCWLLLRAAGERRAMLAAEAGIAAGLTYLFRTEGIGFLLLGLSWFAAAALIWRQTSRKCALIAAISFAGTFMLFAGPYLAYLRTTTGHWSVGREFTAAMMYGMGDVARNGDDWRRLGYAAGASPLAVIIGHPGLYVEKVAVYSTISLYNFAEALEPVLGLLLAVGLWSRGRAVFGRASEALIATIVVFYFCGFVLSYTGTRFMAHLIPFTFGWVVAGCFTSAQTVARWCRPRWQRLAHASIPAALALVLLPRTLWPIGYDMRAIRYAGEDIARLSKGPTAVAARDGRVAFYAGARLVELPQSPVDLCDWLGARRGVGYLILGNRDEQMFDVRAGRRCLELIRRYPHGRSRFYDLYAIRPAEMSAETQGQGPNETQ
jgi:hypothetical protein